MKDFYYILGTDRNATPDELTAAYRKLVQKLHPDDGQQDHFLHDHLREISEAYALLSDPVRRRRYDAAYKKSQRRWLHYFKLRPINIAVTLTLVLFTLLFGFYVYNTLHGHKPAPTVKPILAHKVKHHKKKRLVVIPPAAFTVKPQKIAADTVHHQIAKAPVIIEKPTVVYHPVDEAAATYTTELRSNIHGLIALHASANYRSAILTDIPNHSEVQVLEKGPGFYKISFKGQTGYVAKWTIAQP